MLTTNSKNTNIPSDISSPTMDAISPAESGNATTAGSQTSAEVTDLDDGDFGPIRKGKKGGELAAAPTAPKEESEEEEEETGGRVKTKKEKEKERKKERKKQRKKKEQAARKKAREPMEMTTAQATGLSRPSLSRPSTPSSLSPAPPGEPAESRIITWEEFMVLFRDMRKRWLDRMMALLGELHVDNTASQRAAGDTPSHPSSSAPADNLTERFTADWVAKGKQYEDFVATVGPLGFPKGGEGNEQCEGVVTEAQAKKVLRSMEEDLEEGLAAFQQSIRPRFKAMA